MRITLVTLVALVIAAPVAAQEDGLAGYWKFNIFEDGQLIPFWLIHLDKDKDGKLTATAEPLKRAPRIKIEDVKLGGDTLNIRLVATFNTERGPQQVPLDYEGKLPKPGAKKIFGSAVMGKVTTVPIVLEATAARTPFEVSRETLQKTPTDPRALTAMLDVIEAAKDNKVDAKDLQAWVDASAKTAELYGPRLQLKHNISLLTAIQGQKTYASVGLELARKLSKQVDPKGTLDAQGQLLSLAASALRAGGEVKEAAVLENTLEVLEVKAYAEYSTKPPFKTEKFPGRKGKGTRAVLVELFTGAQCPPCVAADMAFDGLERSYGPGDVVLLQYHMNIPAPEPMSNKDCDERFEMYADAYPQKVRGTPAIVFNGKVEASGGGAKDDSPEKFDEYRKVVNRLLDAPDTLKLSASAARAGDKIGITAKIAAAEKPGAKVRLRLVLVEDWVRFKGGNGLQYHHRVVRAMPGGAKGFAIKDKDYEHKASIDLDELRANLNKYLNDDYPDGPRPMRLRNLSAVAFVQDDDSHEVLQAVNVAVKE